MYFPQLCISFKIILWTKLGQCKQLEIQRWVYPVAEKATTVSLGHALTASWFIYQQLLVPVHVPQGSQYSLCNCMPASWVQSHFSVWPERRAKWVLDTFIPSAFSKARKPFVKWPKYPWIWAGNGENLPSEDHACGLTLKVGSEGCAE